MGTVKVKNNQPEPVNQEGEAQAEDTNQIAAIKANYPVDENGQITITLSKGRQVILEELTARKGMAADRLSDSSNAEDVISHRAIFSVVEFKDEKGQVRKYNFVDSQNQALELKRFEDILTFKDLRLIKEAYLWAFEIDLPDTTNLKNE